jgi:thiazole synthase
VKLEVTPEPRYLLPDPVETLRAAEMLVADGFTVLPYINADPVLAKRLEEAGCATVMPLGSWIGSNRGVRTREAVQIIVEQATVPVVVDAGLGAPSHAAEAMEMGVDAVLVNTAIAVARDPVEMARAFALGVEAGRRAFLAGRGSERADAEASSPLTGFLERLHTSQADPAVTAQ